MWRADVERQEGVCEDVPGLLQHAALVRNMQNKPFIMPVSACVEVGTKEEILKFRNKIKLNFFWKQDRRITWIWQELMQKAEFYFDGCKLATSVS